MKKLSTEINEQLLEMLKTLDGTRPFCLSEGEPPLSQSIQAAFIMATNWELTIPKDANGDLVIEEKE